MDKAFNAGLKFHERPVIGDVRHPASIFGADRIFCRHALPGIGFQLLHAERNTLGLCVEANNLNLDALADLQRIGRVVDAAPRNVGDMQEAVDAAQIDEGAIISDVLDDSLEHLAFVQIGDQFIALLGAGIFEDGPARDDDVAAPAVHF